jgi:phosphonatase-like hydrolase
MRNFDMIVFDMAGTTVRDINEVEFCFQQAAHETGLVAPAERIIGMMGWSKKLVFQTLWLEQLKGLSGTMIDSKIDESYALFKVILENHYKTKEVVPVENCLEVFAELKKMGIKIALTTGFYRNVTNIILSRLGWDEGLDNNFVQKGNGIVNCSVASDDVALGRPAPFMIYHAMEKLNVTDVRRVINLGDTPSDLLSAHNANVGINLGVSFGTHSKKQLEQHPNTSIIDSLEELLDYL